MIIAIDGPAASGKGTLGKRLAAHYGLRHHDTGMIYRSDGLAMLENGYALDDVTKAEEAARALDLGRFGDPELKTARVGEAASIVSAIPQVRAALLKFQQDFAASPPGAVLDGRDIGTVICPNADVKIFVVATPEVRARRRYLEFSSAGHLVTEADILNDIRKRDDRDMHRSAAPLKAAPDAHTLDTTNLDIEGVMQAAIALVEKHRR
jgi:cytidylate kinase